MALESSLCYYPLVPTRGDPADVFDLFHIHDLPYPLKNSSYFVKTVPAAKCLAVAEDRNAYMLLQVQAA